jgi:hypothetical protein
MTKFLKILSLFALLIATPAFGQGQLQTGQIWGNATASQGLPSGNLLGAYLDRSYCNTQNAILVRGASVWACNTTISQSGAATVKGNPSASPTGVADFTLQGLTNLAAPSSTLDFLLIYDHVSGTLKNATVGSISAAGGVTSVNGNAGAIVGVDTNTLNAQTTNYSIASTDCGKTISASGGLFTITLPAVAGFNAACQITVSNADTTRGKVLSGFPTNMMTSPNMLWPLQRVELKIINGAWYASNPGRWAKQNTTFFIDTSGNDINDGQATGVGALRTIGKCISIAELYIDTQGGGNGGVTCSPTAGQTFQEFDQVFFNLVGGGTLLISGNGGQFNWAPANSGFALQFGDLGVVGLTNINFTTNGTTTPLGFVIGHNYGVADFNTGITFTANSPAINIAISCDFDTHFNINNGFNYVGTFSNLFAACQHSLWNLNNAINSTGSTSITHFFTAGSGANVAFQGNVTFSVSGLVTGVALESGVSVVNNLTGTGIPGGTPVPTTGAWYCGPGGTTSPGSVNSSFGGTLGTPC